MIFNSVKFLFFFPLVIVIYFLLPKRFTWAWLLISSYYFYMSWNPKYAILILASTIITFISGLLIDKENKSSADNKVKIKKKRRWVALSFVINLAILFYFKYYNFFTENLISFTEKYGGAIDIPLSAALLPVGISFYTFQALSYTADVYRGDIKAEKHFGHYALFVSFFPQLVAGPIEKSKNFLPQIKEKHSFNYERVKDGLLLIGWGIAKKIVIADRLAVVVNTVYNNPTEYQGIPLIIATLFFSFQIYCDFSGYSDIAIGCAKVMGYNLMENFKRPYFSKSIAEFWRRWHISLGTWFKDYLYIPLGGNRVSRFRVYINLAIVFLVSGLWHGANWKFVIWGALHAFYQIAGQVTQNSRQLIIENLKINKNTYSYGAFKKLTTFALVAFAWIFFRANSFGDAIYIIKNISLVGFNDVFKGSLYELGLDKPDFILSCVSIIVLLWIDKLIENIDIFNVFRNENILFRWAVYYIIIFVIILFGFYGGYNESNFIYFQF